MGFITVILFFTQWIAAFLSFFYPGLREEKRMALLPFHRYFGLAIFAMACATAFAGINEKLMLTLSSDYAQLVPLAVVGNVLVLLIAAFALLVGFIVTYPPYQRVEIED
ncbi:hypothetical protein, partial [Salmonella sp. s55004]|uniref:hypothetical protein n=1 Tax=Salmonella sp. s55004 TaxID=3159675 RepID=UPI00397F6A17